MLSTEDAVDSKMQILKVKGGKKRDFIQRAVKKEKWPWCQTKPTLKQKILQEIKKFDL